MRDGCPAAFPSPARPRSGPRISQQTFAAGDRDRLGMLTARPDRGQHDARGAPDDVGQGRVDSVAATRRGRPSRPGSSDRPAAAARPARCPGRAAAAPSRHRPARHTGKARFGHWPGRTAARRSRVARTCSTSVCGRYWVDLGQHRCQPGDPGVQRVAIRRPAPVRPRSSGTVAGSHGPSSSPTWLEHPRPGRLAQLPVGLDRRHPIRLRRTPGAACPHRVP